MDDLVTVQEVAGLLKSSTGVFFLLDVRRPDEFSMCHIPNSVNIPLDQLSQRFTELPKECPIVTICHHGVRSQHAARFLLENGLEARSMIGGIDEWSLAVDSNIPRY